MALPKELLTLLDSCPVLATFKDYLIELDEEVFKSTGFGESLEEDVDDEI